MKTAPVSVLVAFQVASAAALAQPAAEARMIDNIRAAAAQLGSFQRARGA